MAAPKTENEREDALTLPQVRDLARVRRLLELVATGLTNRRELGLQLGAGIGHPARHAGYYSDAARILGLLESSEWLLTDRGRRLISAQHDSDHERSILREGIAASELGPLVPAILGDEEPDMDAVIDIVRPLCGLREGTLVRRVRDTLSWRCWVSGRHERRRAAERRQQPQLGLFEWMPPVIEPREWPNPSRLPYNWPRENIRVDGELYPDLRAADEVLIIAGFASLQNLCEFIGRSGDRPAQVRIVFGSEPFIGREGWIDDSTEWLSQEVRDYWLERGISIRHASSVLATIEALRTQRLNSRIAARSPGQHAKMAIAGRVAVIGSSNFTEPGLGRQLEANVRLGPDDRDRERVDEARRLAEIYWKLARPFDQELLELLERMLCKVTWQEALARACAELLEGDWARHHLRDELGCHERLWPSQLQGIGQALYVLMEVGSVLIADATGSGKTKTGAWLLRALRQRLVTLGRPIADPVVVSPPAVREKWSDELREAEVGVETYSHGALSNPLAGVHRRVARSVEAARILALDEAHNFINPSQRSALVNTNLADHVVLFTATPINRDVSDLLGIVELLGADNLDDETIEILEDTKKKRRELSEADRKRLRRVVGQFTVRRTKVMFNTLIDQAPERYVDAEGRQCRFPVHKPRYYRLDESAADCQVAAEINRVARELVGVLWLRSTLSFSRAAAMRWSPENYVAMRLNAARALARYQVRVALRSSRAALWEHLFGTSAACEKFDVEPEKESSGDVFTALGKLRWPSPNRLLVHAVPDWLRDADSFRLVCEEERLRYKEIGRLCDQLSDKRERKKAKRLRELFDKHCLVLAFDTRPITLLILRRMLEESSFEILLATGHRPRDQQRVQEAFRLGADTPPTLALCSNALAEGVNLQQASAVVHLDMPSVVRIAEQRVGRVERMDSPHKRVESYWPRDAEEFALATDDRLGARLNLVGELLGSNVSLPPPDERDIEADEPPRMIRPEEMYDEMRRHEQRQVELLDDAFAPVRRLIEGEAALVERRVYAALRHSHAKVISAVAMVRSDSAWGFFALPGTARVAPRWAFVDGPSGPVIAMLDEIADSLRTRLKGVEDVELDEHAVSVMDALLNRLQDQAATLLPRRKQRALEQIQELIPYWRRQVRRDRDSERMRVLDQLDRLASGADGVDYDELIDRWLIAIRPRWRRLLESAPAAKRSGKLRRLAGLTEVLRGEPLETEVLAEIHREMRGGRPLADRVVAAIVGVPSST
jgi:hypothetical protein